MAGQPRSPRPGWDPRPDALDLPRPRLGIRVVVLLAWFSTLLGLTLLAPSATIRVSAPAADVSVPVAVPIAQLGGRHFSAQPESRSATVAATGRDPGAAASGSADLSYNYQGFAGFGAIVQGIGGMIGSLACAFDLTATTPPPCPSPAGPAPTMRIPAGTVLLHPCALFDCSGSDVHFVTTRTVTVPFGGKARVPVRALQPGAGGNLPAGAALDIQNAERYGEKQFGTGVTASAVRFSGGRDAVGAMVRQLDIDTAAASLRHEVDDALSQDIATQAHSAALEPIGALDEPAPSVSSDARAGAAVQSFRVTVSGGATQWAYSGSMLADLVHGSLRDAANGRTLLAYTVHHDVPSLAASGAGTPVVHTVAHASVVRVDPGAVRGLATARSGSSLRRAIERYDAAATVDIQESPDWLPLLPLVGRRITVDVDGMSG